MQVSGATALVTAGGHRVGRAISLALAGAGAGVAVHYRRQRKAAEETAGEIVRGGGRAIVLSAELAETDSLDRLVEEAEAFGPIDVLVANAGAFWRTPLLSVTEQDWTEMLRGNLDSFFLLARRLGPRMRDRGRGCIVALADIAAVRPWTDYGPYSVAKAGGIALTSTLAAVWAPRVRVNAIAPGPILSPSDGDSAAYRREIDRTLARRSGTVEEIASAVCFLVENDFVTGTVLPVDGGRLLAGDV